MRRREAFRTGKQHQSAVASWARERLADGGGRHFDDRTKGSKPKQTGCLFADGVGLGKTWEALAAVVLLLDKSAGLKRQRRAKRAKQRKRRLPPPAPTSGARADPIAARLGSKVVRELRNPDPLGFPARLEKWARRVSSRRFIAKTLEPDNCFAIRRRGDLG